MALLNVALIRTALAAGLVIVPGFAMASQPCVSSVKGVVQLTAPCKPAVTAQLKKKKWAKKVASKKVGSKATAKASAANQKNKNLNRNAHSTPAVFKPVIAQTSVTHNSAVQNAAQPGTRPQMVARGSIRSMETRPNPSQLKSQRVALQDTKSDLSIGNSLEAELESGARSSLKQSDTVRPAAPKRWGILIDSENDVPMNTANRGNGEFLADNLLQFSYKATDTVTVALGEDVINSWGATEKEENGKFQIQDPYFKIGTSNLGTLPGGIPLKASARVYVPLSEYSQSIGQIAYFRSNFAFDKDLGAGFNLGYDGSPRYYWQSYATAVATGEKAPSANKDYRYLQFVKLDWTPSKYFTVSQKTGLDHVWYHGDPAYKIEAKYKEYFFSDTTLNFNFVSWMTLTLGLATDDRDLLNQGNEFSAYREDEAHYYVEVVLTF